MLPTIRTLVTFLSYDNGGRRSLPWLSNRGPGQFMPHLVIQSPDVRVSKNVNGVNTEDYLGVRFISAPKEIVEEKPLDCQMELLYYPQVDYSSVCEGATFTMREGGKIVGYGVVLEVIDSVDS